MLKREERLQSAAGSWQQVVGSKQSPVSSVGSWQLATGSMKFEVGG